MHHASLFPTIAQQVEKMGSLQKFPHKDWKLSTINIEGGNRKKNMMRSCMQTKFTSITFNVSMQNVTSSACRS
jgi:hypothetical protein